MSVDHPLIQDQLLNLFTLTEDLACAQAHAHIDVSGQSMQQANATCSEQHVQCSPEGVYFFQQPGVQASIPPHKPED